MSSNTKPSMRDHILPYTLQNRWDAAEVPTSVPVVELETSKLRAVIIPAWGAKVKWVSQPLTPRHLCMGRGPLSKWFDCQGVDSQGVYTAGAHKMELARLLQLGSLDHRSRDGCSARARKPGPQSVQRWGPEAVLLGRDRMELGRRPGSDWTLCILGAAGVRDQSPRSGGPAHPALRV